MGDLGKIIPSMYYDLIARVGAGTPFLIALLWNQHAEFGDITWSKVALMLGGGYIIGLVLTPFSGFWAPIYLQVRRTSDGPDKKFEQKLMGRIPNGLYLGKGQRSRSHNRQD